MAYGVKYRIKYCDKNNVEAKVEIEVRGYTGAVQTVEGTPDVFLLRYDLGGKQNNIISSFADINLFENPITIDDLKTLNETDIRVSFYLANDLKWQGFALPDFFETDIKNNAVISISATDRLSVLKDKTIGGFEVNVTPMRLISEALKQTGLSLNINSIINFSAPGVTDVMRHLTLNGQRLTDDRGRNISAYDILSSLLALFNSYIVQRNNEWYIINKWQLENGGGTLYKSNASGAYQSSSTFTPTQINFDEISAGGRRKIEAGALEVSLFGEYGGMPIYPNNYDFRLWGLNGFDGWSAKNGFVAMVNENEVTGYSGNNAIIGSGSVNRRLRFKHEAFVPNPYIGLHLESDEWVSLLGNEVNINISINATSKNKTVFGVGIIVKDADGNLWTQNASNTWKKRDSKYTGGIYMPIVFDDENAGANDVVSISSTVGASIRASDLGDDVLSLSGASAKFVIFGTALNAVDVFISNAKIAIKQSGDQPQGTLFKVQQQNDFSKKFDTQTIIFSDYVRSGINGHFYPYRSDDTSIIRPITKFSANGETDYLALLSARQASRLFSSARDVLTITINASSIDPLAVYVCGSKKYIATESVFDFFRSKLDLKLEENVVNATEKKDFVYSYFGEGDESVRSVGGISGGGTSTGSGGSTLQYWQLDEDGNLYTEYNAYSTQELSAYGLGSGGGGGGGGSLVTWGTELNGGVGLTVDGISKTLALKSGLDLKQDKLIAGSGITIVGNTISSTGDSGGGTVVSWGTEVNSFIPLTVEGISKTVALQGHTHTFASLTSKPTTLSGYGITDAYTKTQVDTSLNGKVNKSGDTMTGGLSFENIANPNLGAGSGFRMMYNNTSVQGNFPNAYSNVASFITQYSGFQLGSYSGDESDFFFRKRRDTNEWYPWYKVFHTGNLDMSDYVKKSGDTMTGDLTMNSNKSTAWPNTINNDGNNFINLSRLSVNINNNGLHFFGDGATNARRFGIQSGHKDALYTNKVYGVLELNPFGGRVKVGWGGLDVLGEIASVHYKTQNWRISQIGSELNFFYNDVLKSRMLTDGSFVAMSEVTAYGTASGGSSPLYLPLTGGTLTGKLTVTTDNFLPFELKRNSLTAGTSMNLTNNRGLIASIVGEEADGVGNLLFRTTDGDVLKLFNNKNIEAYGLLTTPTLNTNKIEMGNGWTIEQTTSALTIKKNGVVKGTFNA